MKKLLFAILMLPSFILAQELNASVTVNYEQLETAGKERLRDFEGAVEDYINNTRFTDLDWEGEPIPCTFNIFFISNQGETRYSAQVVVTSQRPVYKSSRNSLMLNILDKEWNFEYEKNQTMRLNLANFDPLTSFIDFYAYLIIAFDMESYNELGGVDYFNKAYDIALLGSNSQFSAGWTMETARYNKRKLLDEAEDASFNQFRKDYFNYHYNGIDLYTENPKETHAVIERMVNYLYDNIDKMGRNSVFLRVFFEAKAGEIVDYLSGYEDDTIFQKLMKVDPGNISKYQQAMDK